MSVDTRVVKCFTKSLIEFHPRVSPRLFVPSYRCFLLFCKWLIRDLQGGRVKMIDVGSFRNYFYFRPFFWYLYSEEFEEVWIEEIRGWRITEEAERKSLKKYDTDLSERWVEERREPSNLSQELESRSNSVLLNFSSERKEELFSEVHSLNLERKGGRERGKIRRSCSYLTPLVTFPVSPLFIAISMYQPTAPFCFYSLSLYHPHFHLIFFQVLS